MIETKTLLDIIRFAVGITILFYASYTDFKTRKASNLLWLLMALIGIILLIIQFLTTGFENLFYILFIPLMIGLIYVLYQLRLIFGGADAKALMTIAILVPFEPTMYMFPLLKNGIMPFSWSIFSNSLIIFLFIPLSILVYNIIKKDIEFPYVFFGYKMSLKKAKEKFVWPLEKLQNGKRKFVYMPKDFDVTEELNEFEKNNITEIWVTPKIPFMIPLLIGYIFAFIFGDILFYIFGLF
ncbi:MAG: A24 family peptidase C-terminal domain-containing protein [Candidatus Thermoplasmatota archaeon]|jgi:preflagellin peptidase FlaK|nr:A24 family peptidase C-terminal domain-containing protein [Candidatus Thermoplasmatota archaeon]